MPINTGGTASSAGKKSGGYGSPQTGAAGSVSGGSVRSTAGGGGYGGYGGASSTGRAGAGYSGCSGRSSPEGGGGGGSPAGASGGRAGGQNQGGQSRSGAGGAGGVRNVSGLGGTKATRESYGSMLSSALAGAPRMATSLPGSYAGPKGLVGRNFALSNQALAAPFGPYGSFDAVNDPAGHLMQRSLARGWSPNASRGMIGNFDVESGLNPLAAGDLRNKAGLAAGLAQHRLDRLAALQAETQPFGDLNRKDKVFGYGPTLDQQFDFVDRQLTGLTTKGFKPDPGAVRAGWNLANPDISTADATRAFARNYERPSRSALRTSMPGRLAGTNFGFGAPSSTPTAPFNVVPASYAPIPRAKPTGILSGRPKSILGLGMPRSKPLTPSVIGKSMLGINRGAFYGY